MAVLTSKEYVDAHSGGSGSTTVFKLHKEGASASSVDISGSNWIDTTLITLPNMTQIDSSKYYKVRGHVWVEISGLATNAADVELITTMAMTNSAMQVVPENIATRIPASSASLRNFNGVFEGVALGSAIKGDTVKVRILGTGVAGAIANISMDFDMTLEECSVTEITIP